MEEEVKKSKRGGARAGAGRKREEHRRKTVALIISEEAWTRLSAYAAARGQSASAAASDLFEGLNVDLTNR